MKWLLSWRPPWLACTERCNACYRAGFSDGGHSELRVDDCHRSRLRLSSATEGALSFGGSRVNRERFLAVVGALDACCWPRLVRLTPITA